jgi:hypothetical protein
MSVIGVDLDSDQLVLTRGRDFKWTFQNVDQNDQPVDFPAGRLYFELQTGGQQNARQLVTLTGAAGGTYKVTAATPAVPYDASELVLKDVLEQDFGIGNVKVTGSYIPTWSCRLASSRRLTTPSTPCSTGWSGSAAGRSTSQANTPRSRSPSR